MWPFKKKKLTAERAIEIARSAAMRMVAGGLYTWYVTEAQSYDEAGNFRVVAVFSGWNGIKSIRMSFGINATTFSVDGAVKVNE